MAFNRRGWNRNSYPTESNLWREPQVWMTLLAAVAGLVLMVISLSFGMRTHQFRQRARRVTGTVIRSVEVSAKKGYRYRPVVRITGANGKPLEFNSEVERRKPYEEGEAVTVLYDPGTPEMTEVESNSYVAGPWVLGGIGAFLFLAAGGMLVWMLRDASGPR